MVQILITRPRPQAEALARSLEPRGYTCRIEPMLEIERLDTQPPALDGIQAIVLTSAHAVPALPERAKRLPVFAVGGVTAAAARAAGCTDVTVAEGDAVNLARCIATGCRPEQGALLHLSGVDVRESLAEALAMGGFELRRAPVYRAVAASRLSAALQAALEQRALDAVLLFSPRTARTFVELVRRYRLGDRLDGTAALCLSGAVADAARALRWGEVRSAHRPEREALVQLLEARERRWYAIRQRSPSS